MTWRSAAETGARRAAGKYHSYPASGFVATLSAQSAAAELERIRAARWIDTKTRAVMVDLVAYAPGADLTAASSVLFEVLPGLRRRAPPTRAARCAPPPPAARRPRAAARAWRGSSCRGGAPNARVRRARTDPHALVRAACWTHSFGVLDTLVRCVGHTHFTNRCAGGIVDASVGVEVFSLDRYPLATQHDFALAALELFVYVMVAGCRPTPRGDCKVICKAALPPSPAAPPCRADAPRAAAGTSGLRPRGSRATGCFGATARCRGAGSTCSTSRLSSRPPPSSSSTFGLSLPYSLWCPPRPPPAPARARRPARRNARAAPARAPRTPRRCR